MGRMGIARSLSAAVAQSRRTMEVGRLGSVIHVGGCQNYGPFLGP